VNPVAIRRWSMNRIWILGFLATTVLLLAFRPTIESSVRAGAVIATVVTLFSVVSVVRTNPTRPISLGSVYAALFGLFHIGLLIMIAFGFPARVLDPTDTSWVLTPGFTTAAFLVAIAQIAMTVGYLVRIRPARVDAELILPEHGRPQVLTFADGAAVVGMGLLIIGLMLWARNVIVGGVSLSGSYPDFLAATSKTNMPTAYLMMGFGMGVVSASRWPAVRGSALIAFGVWSVPAFILGLRGEVIIPAAAFLVVAARRRLIRLRPWMLLAVAGALAVGSAVRVVRRLGVGRGSAALDNLNPLDGLAELGYSIRPLSVASQAHDQLGEPFVGVATYLAPFRRLIVGRLLGGQVTPVADDPAVFGTWILQRVGPIGGSPAAEAYRVGGTIAVICVMFAIGFLIASLDSLRPSLIGNAMIGMLTFVLLLWVRNDFTPVPAECLVTIPIAAAIWLIDKQSSARSRSKPELVRTA